VLSEFELIAAIRERLALAGAPRVVPGLIIGSGDDAAASARAGASVVSVDALVEGVHFRMPPFEPRDVGYKALAVALSDLAAMAAEPREAYVQLGVPEAFADEGVLEVADGVGALAGAHGVAVAGGDVTRAAELFLAVTVVGEAASAGSLVRRAGARAGDLIAVTGELGGAAAAVLAFERPELGRELDPVLAERLRRRQLEPQPRLEAALALQRTAARAMIDVSDGLGADAAHLAAASSVAVRIELEALPLQDGVREVAAAADLDPLDLAAAGGEDYELLVALAPERERQARAALERLGLALTVIGAADTGAGVELRSAEGVRPPGGFDQMRRRPAPEAPA
jgi:thiamine-monophosphate kinase